MKPHECFNSHLCRLPQWRGLIWRQRFHQCNKMPPCIGGGLNGILGLIFVPLRMSASISIATN
jgi:hypothetical protein